MVVLRNMARRWREQGEDAVEVPYGPHDEAPEAETMSKADAAAGVLWIGATLYAVFGGADFGAGFWSLVAGKGERGHRARGLIERAIGPVWEANHVWLIFILVVLWTAFSVAFEAVMSTLFIPLCLAALGIVLRGAGFAFQESAVRSSRRNFAEHLFAASSVITPFFMGTVVGAVASGRVPLGNAAGDPVTSWLNPVSILVGVLFVATGAYLAAVFLISDARRFGDADLERYFSDRALVAAVATGAIALAGILVLRADARYVYDGLTSEGIPLVILSAIGGFRVGGRIYTLREPFTPGLYAEAGAMRIPRSHDSRSHYSSASASRRSRSRWTTRRRTATSAAQRVRHGEVGTTRRVLGFETADARARQHRARSGARRSSRSRAAADRR